MTSSRWLAGEPVRARRISAGERLMKWASRRPSMAALVVVSALAVVAAIAGLAVGFLAVAAEKTRTDQALEKYKECCTTMSKSLRVADQTSYYQTIALAAPESMANNVRRADQLLDDCPMELRQWEWGTLKRLCHEERLSLTCPDEPAAASFSADGLKVAAAGGHSANQGSSRSGTQPTVAKWARSVVTMTR